MSKLTLGQVLDKYERECSSRQECGECPYDKSSDTGRWDCFKNCLVSNGVAKSVISLLEPVVRGVADEWTMTMNTCPDCDIVLTEMCIVCKAKETVDCTEEVPQPEYIRVSDLTEEWDKLFKDTPYESLLPSILANIEHRR